MIYRTPTILLFLIVVIWIPRIQGDPFIFEVDIQCAKTIPHWCGELIIYEEDDRNHDVLRKHQFCTKDTSVQFVSELINPGGDFGFEYEFKYKLKHTCSSDGQERCIQLEKRLDMPKGLARTISWNITAFASGRLQCYDDGL